MLWIPTGPGLKRYERIRTERVHPRDENALPITTDGGKLALGARMVEAKPRQTTQPASGRPAQPDAARSRQNGRRSGRVDVVC